MNLVTNAQQALELHSKREMIITVSSHFSGDKNNVVLSIKDNAGGVPEEIRDSIFESFFTTKPPGSGTGLGLYISKMIVEKAGGRIELEVEEGHGSTFKVILPGNKS